MGPAWFFNYCNGYGFKGKMRIFFKMRIFPPKTSCRFILFCMLKVDIFPSQKMYRLLLWAYSNLQYS